MSRQRFSSAAKAAFEKQGGLFSPHPSTHLLPGRQGKSKQVVSCLSPRWLGGQCPLKGQLVAAQTPFCEQPEASGSGLFAWYKQDAGPGLSGYVRKRHPGGFLQNALLLKEGTIYVPSGMLRDGPAWMK